MFHVKQKTAILTYISRATLSRNGTIFGQLRHGLKNLPQVVARLGIAYRANMVLIPPRVKRDVS